MAPSAARELAAKWSHDPVHDRSTTSVIGLEGDASAVPGPAVEDSRPDQNTSEVRTVRQLQDESAGLTATGVSSVLLPYGDRRRAQRLDTADAVEAQVASGGALLRSVLVRGGGPQAGPMRA